MEPRVQLWGGKGATALEVAEGREHGSPKSANHSFHRPGYPDWPSNHSEWTVFTCLLMLPSSCSKHFPLSSSVNLILRWPCLLLWDNWGQSFTFQHLPLSACHESLFTSANVCLTVIYNLNDLRNVVWHFQPSIALPAKWDTFLTGLFSDWLKFIKI